MKDVKIYDLNQSGKKQQGTYILCYEFLLSSYMPHLLWPCQHYVPFFSQKNKQSNFKKKWKHLMKEKKSSLTDIFADRKGVAIQIGAAKDKAREDQC